MNFDNENYLEALERVVDAARHLLMVEEEGSYVATSYNLPERVAYLPAASYDMDRHVKAREMLYEALRLLDEFLRRKPHDYD